VKLRPHSTHLEKHSRWNAIRWIALAFAALGTVAFVACEKSPPPRSDATRRFVYVSPPPRVATSVPDGLTNWIQILNAQREEMLTLQEKLASQQEIHVTNKFDDFLKTDPTTLGREELAALWHFADKGYFTVERDIVIKLLEDRLGEKQGQPGGGDAMLERARTLAEQNELKLRDLRTANEMYAKVHQGEFHVPATLDAQGMETLQGMVREKLTTASLEVSKLEERIRDLQTRLNERLGAAKQ
jgi:hypothetical protein